MARQRGSADDPPDDAQAVRNQATNAIANSGRGGASTGAAVSTAPEQMVPLSAVARFETGHAPLAVNHQGLFAATTISFNLKPGVSLGEATRAIDDAILRIGVPATIVGTFEGTARAFQSSLRTQPLLILAALLAVYIVLGVLYESLVHPITILSTLPSAGVGAVLALLLFDTEFSIMALIGVILLIGIVKKNAIMMIDFALAAERSQGLGVARGDLPGGAAALSSDHDDDGRGDARRRAAGDRVRRGFGIAPAARHRDRRRAAREPDADAVHDPDRLSVP